MTKLIYLFAAYMTGKGLLALIYKYLYFKTKAIIEKKSKSLIGNRQKYIYLVHIENNVQHH